MKHNRITISLKLVAFATDTASAATFVVTTTSDGGPGVLLEGDENRVQRNFIGTDVGGGARVPNQQAGVEIRGARNLVGGHVPLALNVVSGNAGHGVLIAGPAATGNEVLGNFIGLDATGVAALANTGDGVHLTRDAHDNAVGHLERGNVIAGNGGHGVQVRGGTGNRIQGNSIHANGRLGIDLFADGDPASGVTPNDPLDPDVGSNTLQNFPVLGQVTLGPDTMLSGRLNSTPGQAFGIELFRSAAADPSGHGEGEVFVARQTVTTDGAGNADFQFEVPGNWAGWWFTATATVQATGDTSEFGPALLAAPPLRFTAVRRVDGSFMVEFPTLAGPPLRAATLVWTNTAGGAWNVAAYWSPNAVPAAADDAFITNVGTYTVTVNAAAVCGNLTVGSNDGVGTQTVVISGGQTLTVNNNADWATNLILRFDGAVVATSGGSPVRATVESDSPGIYQVSATAADDRGEARTVAQLLTLFTASPEVLMLGGIRSNTTLKLCMDGPTDTAHRVQATSHLDALDW